MGYLAEKATQTGTMTLRKPCGQLVDEILDYLSLDPESSSTRRGAVDIKKAVEDYLAGIIDIIFIS